MSNAHQTCFSPPSTRLPGRVSPGYKTEPRPAKNFWAVPQPATERVQMRVLGFLSIATLFAACGDTTMMMVAPPDVTTVSSANPAQYVANSLTVPLDRMQFGMDLNGDGKTDNQLGNIIGALSANNLNTQDGVDASVCKGAVVLLLTTTSADATFQNDDATGAFVNVGKAFAYVDTNMDGKCGAGDTAPKYDGTDTFMKDTSSFQGSQFYGR